MGYSFYSASLIISCFFIAQPILSLLGTEMIYDWIFFKELIGEIVTLIISIGVYKELKKNIL